MADGFNLPGRKRNKENALDGSFSGDYRLQSTIRVNTTCLIYQLKILINFQASEIMQAEGRSIHFCKNVQKTSRNLGPILQVLPLSKGLFKIAEVTPPHIRNYCCFVLI